ncbi:TPA: hypothetical protein ACH3X1_011330 [Trebouxia sp. C0004]
MPSIADFEADLAKVDKYLKEDLIPPMAGGFENFCSTAIIDEYANAWTVTAAENVVVIRLVFDRGLRQLANDGRLGVNHTQEGLFAILCESVVDYSASKQAGLAAAMNPAPEGDAANAQFAGRTLASAAQSHPARADADARRVSPAGSAAADDLDVMHEEEQPPQAEANMISGVHYPPPSAFLKHILQGKTDPNEVMQLTSMYFREYSKYGSEDYSTTAEDEHNPVAKAATYLRGDALDWWQQSGYMSMPPDADFEQFSTTFLKRFVKPADSAKARRELPLLRQEGQSVETYAAKFNNMNNRITEGTAIDSTTLAVYFQQGLTRRISTALVNSQSIATMQNLALVMAAAEEIECKLDLSAKQATQVEVPSTGNPNSAKRGRYSNGNTNASFNNISTNNRGGGRGPFNAGRGNVARGRGTRGRGGGRGRAPPPWPVISASV